MNIKKFTFAEIKYCSAMSTARKIDTSVELWPPGSQTKGGKIMCVVLFRVDKSLSNSEMHTNILDVLEFLHN